MIVLDVSAVIPFLLYNDREIRSAIKRAVEILAPDLYVPESGNVLLQYVKKKLITIEEAHLYIRQSIGVVDNFVNLNNQSPEILSMAYDTNLSFYENQYLFLTKSMNGKILSKDNKLNKVAEKMGLKY